MVGHGRQQAAHARGALGCASVANAAAGAAITAARGGAARETAPRPPPQCPTERQPGGGGRAWPGPLHSQPQTGWCCRGGEGGARGGEGRGSGEAAQVGRVCCKQGGAQAGRGAGKACDNTCMLDAHSSSSGRQARCGLADAPTHWGGPPSRSHAAAATAGPRNAHAALTSCAGRPGAASWPGAPAGGGGWCRKQGTPRPLRQPSWRL